MPALPGRASAFHPIESWWRELAPFHDQSAVTLLQAEREGGRSQRSVYELFSEIEEKDAHFYSLIQTRLNGLLGLDRRVVPHSPAGSGELRTAEFVEEALERIPRFDGLLRALLDGVAKGFAVVELRWGYDTAGRIIVTDWVAHPQEWFTMTPGGELLLLSPPFRAQEGDSPPGHGLLPDAGRTDQAATRLLRPTPRKFLVLRFDASVRHPFGRGLAQHAYWLYWLKKNVLKYWSIHNERHGSPTAVATFGPGASEDDLRRMREVLESIQTDTGVIIPESFDLKLLEAARSGNGATYREFLDWANDELSKLILGATLTSGEGRRSGSLALGNIHQLVRQDYIESDARLLEEVLNGDLVRWLCELNLPPGTALPRLRIDTESPEDLEAKIAVDRDLLNMGVTLPLSYFYQAYGRPAPSEEDMPLRYDDANFYQYHLQYGVLTINEVRHRLNLPPVPWGGQRTSTPDRNVPGAELSGEDRGTRPR